MADSLWPRGLQPTSLLCPWDFPGKNTGADCHFLCQGIFPTQGSNPSLMRLLNLRQILYHWASEDSCLENPMDRGTWQATVHGVAKSWMLLSNLTIFFFFEEAPPCLTYHRNSDYDLHLQWLRFRFLLGCLFTFCFSQWNTSRMRFWFCSLLQLST